MKELIEKLLQGDITHEELQILREALNKSRNLRNFEGYLQREFDLNLALLDINLESAFSRLKLKTGKRDFKSRRRHLSPYLKYAAALLFFVALGLTLRLFLWQAEANERLVPKNESVLLELHDGRIDTIDVNQSKSMKSQNGILVARQEKDRITYENSDTKELSFNTIRVPYGKRFSVNLSDGTEVFLNSGSSLKYPVSFLDTGQRSVFVKGEAYFDVAPDASRPFIVRTDLTEVKVLGTRFNVSAYEEDDFIDVALVEGAVNLRPLSGAKKNTLTPMNPGQLARFGKLTGEISLVDVNTNLYTMWMQNRLVFRNQTFDDILRKLERHYNVDFENHNEKLGREEFNATFYRVGVDSVLNYFNKAHEIDFKIMNNKVIID
ncbi:FecR family protein [Flagellimonas hymeniacidonis]|nr:FecR family protein [Flagellimonas hymeniacidonis]